MYPNVDNVEVFSIYKERSIILRFIRFCHHKFKVFPKCRKFWLGSWKNKVDCDTNVIIFDTLFDDFPLDFLLQQKVNRIIVCYRNRVHDINYNGLVLYNPCLLKKIYRCDVWSYSEQDCLQYNLNLYHQFHIISKSDIDVEINPIYDFFFVGSDKGRISTIVELAHRISSLGFSYLFKVVPTASNYSDQEKQFLSKPIPYNEVIGYIKKSKCVVDIVSNQNCGLTYRSLEAYIFKKKLITNYMNIINESFYNKDNVFIIGYDDFENLSDFIAIPFKADCDIYKEYSFETFCATVFKV